MALKKAKKLAGKRRRDQFGRYSSTAQSVRSRRFNRALMRKLPKPSPRKRSSNGTLYNANGGLVSRKRQMAARRRQLQRRG